MVGCHTIETCRFFLPTKNHSCGGVLNKKHPVAVGGSDKQNWFQTFYIFNPTLGEDSNFDKHRFQMGQSTNQPPTRKHAAGMNRKMILYVKTQFAISPRLVRPGGDGVGPGDWKKHTTPEEVQVFDEKNGLGRSLASLHLSGGMTYICLVNIWVHVFETQPACLGKN